MIWAAFTGRAQGRTYRLPWEASHGRHGASMSSFSSTPACSGSGISGSITDGLFACSLRPPGTMVTILETRNSSSLGYKDVEHGRPSSHDRPVQHFGSMFAD